MLLSVHIFPLVCHVCVGILKHVLQELRIPGVLAALTSVCIAGMQTIVVDTKLIVAILW
jgi:hypothetical protein